MKGIDLRYFLMKHFNNEFTNDAEVPRQWPSLREEEIKALFVNHASPRNKRRGSTSHSSITSLSSSSHSKKGLPQWPSTTSTRAKYQNRVMMTPSPSSPSLRNDSSRRNWKKT